MSSAARHDGSKRAAACRCFTVDESRRSQPGKMAIFALYLGPPGTVSRRNSTALAQTHSLRTRRVRNVQKIESAKFRFSGMTWNFFDCVTIGFPLPGSAGGRTATRLHESASCESV